MKIIIPDTNKYKNIIKEIKNSGLNNLIIISDFDRTLTYGSVDGVQTPSIISMLRDGKHLTDEYAKKAHELFDKYHPMEINPDITLDEKKIFMKEWWDKHNELLIDSGLRYSDLTDIVKNGELKLREGVDAFLDILHKFEIPLIIFSASGCGDAIQLFLEKKGKTYSNISYFTNRFNWDEIGRAISVRQPVIHSFNKSGEVLLEDEKLFSLLKNRSNVIMLGDGLGDVKMVDGLNHQHLLKIGFLNSEDEKLRQKYEKKFDLVFEGDGDFFPVNELINDLL